MPAKRVYVEMQKDKHASTCFALKYMCLQNDNEIDNKGKQHFELWIRGNGGNLKKKRFGNKYESSHLQSDECRLAVSQEREVPFEGSFILDSAVMESLN